MTTTAVLEARTAEFDVDEVEYLRQGDACFGGEKARLGIELDQTTHPCS